MTMEAPLLLALQQAPALLISCKSAGCLKQLRAVSRTSRSLATSVITTFTVLSGNASQQADLQRMMKDCKLTKVQLIVAELGAALYGDNCFPSASGAFTAAMSYDIRVFVRILRSLMIMS